MKDNYAVPPGTLGTISLVDDMGTIHVDWDNGQHLGVVLGVDTFYFANEQILDKKMITVLIVEPNMHPYVAIIEDELSQLQGLVGGYIEEYRLSETASIICNEEGKLLNLPANRRVQNDIITGRLFITGINDDEGIFESLSQEDIELYTSRFEFPENIPQHEVQENIGYSFNSF